MISAQVLIINANGVDFEVHYVEVHAPPPLEPLDEHADEWAYEHLFPLTGGNGAVDVTASVLGCTDPRLEGWNFSWTDS